MLIPFIDEFLKVGPSITLITMTFGVNRLMWVTP